MILFVPKQSVDELSAVEDFQLIHALTNADVVHGDANGIAGNSEP